MPIMEMKLSPTPFIPLIHRIGKILNFPYSIISNGIDILLPYFNVNGGVNNSVYNKCAIEDELISDYDVIVLLIISFKSHIRWPLILKRILESYIYENNMNNKVNDIYERSDCSVIKYIQYKIYTILFILFIIFC